jgi:hypothetical protein
MAKQSVYESLFPRIEQMEKRGDTVLAARIVIDTCPAPKVLLLKSGWDNDDYGHFTADCMNNVVNMDSGGYGTSDISKPRIDLGTSFVWFASGAWIELKGDEYDGWLSVSWIMHKAPGMHPDCL